MYKRQVLAYLNTAQTGQNGDASGTATAARCSGIAGTIGRPGAGANIAADGTGGSPLANRSRFPVMIRENDDL